MLQRDSTILLTSANFGAGGSAPVVVAVRGPAADSQAIGRHAGRRDAPGPPRAALAVMPRIEEVADHRADRQHDGDDQPVVTGGEKQRIMVAQHQKDDRQGQIIVVHRALLAERAPAPDRASLPAIIAATVFF